MVRGQQQERHRVAGAGVVGDGCSSNSVSLRSGLLWSWLFDVEEVIRFLLAGYGRAV